MKTRKARRSGLTLIEILVTLISSSLILTGLSIVIVTMAKDQKDVASAREQAFGRIRGIGEINWTLKQASRRGIRQEEAGGHAPQQVDDPNLTPAGQSPPSVGVPWIATPAMPTYSLTIQNHGVITYVIDNYNQSEDPAFFSAASSRTGIIYQLADAVYRFETLLSTVPAGVPGVVSPTDPIKFSNRSTSGFNGMDNTAINTWINTPANVAASEVLALGVDRLQVSYVKDPVSSKTPINVYSIHWELVFLKNTN